MKKSIFLFFAAILCAIGMNAATPTKIYLNAKDWGYGDARFAAYFFDPAKWVDMKKVDGETFIYEVDVPAGYTKVILCRMNGGTTANNWDNKWNQTGDLNIPTDGRDMFKPDDWNGKTTTWSTYTPTVTHTFAKNSTLYIDFRAITDKKGANYPKAGSVGIDYSANAGGTVIPVTFTADVKWTEGAEFMKTEKGGWASIPFKAPEAGQNCAQVAADGKSYTWTTYSENCQVTVSAENGTVEGAGTYKRGTSVTLTAAPNDGYEFVNWTVGGKEVSTANPYTFTVNDNITLVANFKEAAAKTYTITTSATNGTVEGAATVVEGESVTLKATANPGYKFVNWTVGGVEVSTDNPYTFIPTEDATVVANFEQLPPETVYFVNAADWTGTINIHAWGGTASGTAWPGNPAHKEDYQIGGHDVYSLTAAAGAYANVIFNNKVGDAGNQTADLEWTAGKYYVIDGWYTRSEAEEKLAVPVPTYDYYVVGTFNSWANPDPNHGMTLVGDVYKATVTLNVGANMLKVTNGTWENAKGFSAMGAEYEEVSNDTQDGNILITLTEGKDVVVVYNATTGKVTFEGLTEKVVVTPDVITYVLMGVGNDWTTGIALTKNETAEYGEEYVLLGQEIAEGDAVKVVTLTNGVATAWCGNVDEYSVEHSADDMGNIVLAPGKYNFYFKVNNPATADDDIIYIDGEAYPEVPTALDNIDATVAPVKAIVNGQLVITKDGVQYNAQGQVVK